MFKNQAEMMQALLDGECIIYKGTHNYYRLENGNIIDHNGESSSVTTGLYSEYSIYKPPKKKKTITLYRYTYMLNGTYNETNWTSDASVPYDWAILKEETKKVEIEE